MTIKFNLAWEALVNHFGEDNIKNIISSRRQFGAHLLPDIQNSVSKRLSNFDKYLCGVHPPYENYTLTVSGMLVRTGVSTIAITPLQYREMDIGNDEPFAALNNGMWLFKIEDKPIVVLMSHFETLRDGKFAQIEVASLPDTGSLNFSHDFIKSVQDACACSSLYKGKVLSFEGVSDYSGMRSELQVHKLPIIARDDVILDDFTMSQIDDHVFNFHKFRTKLKNLGQSIRKGVLLYGPPGTGKTHIIKHIISNVPERTTVLISADEVLSLSRYMLLARTLQPSIVVIEDIDLVGRSRENMNSPKAEILLNRLLNEMDGLKEDADVMFILTTNRPSEIEDALSSRPGRVDEAIEVAYPNVECRTKLVKLYGSALKFEDGAINELVSRSEGASPAFIKEIVRRLAQVALSHEQGNFVRCEHVVSIVSAALSSKDLRKKLIGASNCTDNKYNHCDSKTGECT